MVTKQGGVCIHILIIEKPQRWELNVESVCDWLDHFGFRRGSVEKKGTNVHIVVEGEDLLFLALARRVSSAFCVDTELRRLDQFRFAEKGKVVEQTIVFEPKHGSVELHNFWRVLAEWQDIRVINAPHRQENGNIAVTLEGGLHALQEAQTEIASIFDMTSRLVQCRFCRKGRTN